MVSAGRGRNTETEKGHPFPEAEADTERGPGPWTLDAGHFGNRDVLPIELQDEKERETLQEFERMRSYTGTWRVVV